MRERPTLPYKSTRNTRESPLLRLPAELREQIWIYAFGCRAVHIRVRNPDRTTAKRWCLSFDACKEVIMDNEVKCLDRMKGTPRWKEAVAQARSTGTFIGSHKLCEKDSNTIFTIVPLVCKQIYYETMPIAWKHSVITFDNGWDFARFSHFATASADLISQLSIHTTDNQLYIRWRHGLENSDLISQFTSLQGLNLVQMYTGTGPADLNEDLFEMPYHTVGLFRIVIEAFQRFPLLGERTTVSIYRKISRPHPVESLPGLADQARNDLLNQNLEESCARDTIRNVN